MKATSDSVLTFRVLLVRVSLSYGAELNMSTLFLLAESIKLPQSEIEKKIFKTSLDGALVSNESFVDFFGAQFSQNMVHHSYCRKSFRPLVFQGITMLDIMTHLAQNVGSTFNESIFTSTLMTN